ncbi:MAG: hypothetical protein WCI05_04800 [Myxococcales bacterium]
MDTVNGEKANGSAQVKLGLAKPQIGGGKTDLGLEPSQVGVDKLDGLSSCVKLEIFFIGNNVIKSWEEVAKLAMLPTLKNVLFYGNDIYKNYAKEDARLRVIKRIPNISIVDGKMIDDNTRKQAEETQ